MQTTTPQYLTVTRAAKLVNLSRSTLLHYDTIGLLSPAARSHAGYRLYSESDITRLKRIQIFRQAGIPLSVISSLLEAGEAATVRILENQLKDLNQEIQQLRRQQSIIVDLLGRYGCHTPVRVMNKDQWIQVLRKTGLNDVEMQRWHYEFERQSPEAHQDFLESLGIPEVEISRIRKWSAMPPDES